MEGFYVFGIALIIAILISSGRVFYKFGFSVDAYKKYWKYSEGNTSILLSHLKLFAAIMVITFLSMWVGGAFAGEWLKGGSVTIGIQSSSEQSVFCVQKGINNKNNSNFTWNQNIWRQKYANTYFVTGVNYTHHSCESSPDSVGYDKPGLFIGLIY